MGFGVEILADSVSPDGVRLTTFLVTLPRIVLAEFNTHRVFSRNSASSRAIPVKKMIERVMTDPYIPTTWGKNQKGMQAQDYVPGEAGEDAHAVWLSARHEAVRHAEALLKLGIHKQLTNRLLEAGHMSPFEHVARPMTPDDWPEALHNHVGGPMTQPRWSGNLNGWVQYRKTIPGEADILGAKAVD